MNNTTWIAKIFIRSVIAISLVGSSAWVQAELIDNSKTYRIQGNSIESGEQVVDYPRDADARWKDRPKYHDRYMLERLPRYSPTCDCDEQGQPLANCQKQQLTMVVALIVSPQGDIERIQVLESSGVPYFDRIARGSLRQATFYPFIKEGKPVRGRVTAPLSYFYEPMMHESCYGLRQSIQKKQSAK